MVESRDMKKERKKPRKSPADEILAMVSSFDLEGDIQDAFFDLLNLMVHHLKLRLVNARIQACHDTKPVAITDTTRFLLDFGVTRKVHDNVREIHFHAIPQEFVPIVVLREAYSCFVPNELKDLEAIKILINYIVENDLSVLDVTKKWQKVVRERIADGDFSEAQSDRLNKFFDKTMGDVNKGTTRFFFQYLRRHATSLASLTMKDLFNAILKEYVLKSAKSIRNDELVETIRILLSIFYTVKNYTSLTDFKAHFTDLQEKGVLNTELSVTRFSENVNLLAKNTNIGPSYKINWNAMGLVPIHCTLTFNPLLPPQKIARLLTKIPFFHVPKFSTGSFSFSVKAVLLPPKVYLNDAGAFFNALIQRGYLTEKTLMVISETQMHLNLNYFREFHEKGRIINPQSKAYDEKYEISFTMRYGEKYTDPRFSLLEFLTVERLPQYASGGFSFEKRAMTIKRLRSILFNEFIVQKKKMQEFKTILELIHDDEDLRKNLLTFMKANEGLGALYVEEMMARILSTLEVLEKFMAKNEHVKSAHHLHEVISTHEVAKTLSQGLLVRDEKVMKQVFHELMPLYFEEHRKFKTEKTRLVQYQKFFNTCFTFKIFSFSEMKRFLQDELTTSAFIERKEEAIKNAFKGQRVKNVTIDQIDAIVHSFMTRKPPIIKPLMLSTLTAISLAPCILEFTVKATPESREVIKSLKSYFPRFNISEGVELITKEPLIDCQAYVPLMEKSEKHLLVSTLHSLFKGDLITLDRSFFDGFLPGISRKDHYDFERKRYVHSKELFPQALKYAEQVLGDSHHPLKERRNPFLEDFWSHEKGLNKLVDQLNYRLQFNQPTFQFSLLENLMDFHANLHSALSCIERLEEVKDEDFFKSFIHAIKFKPAYHAFGLSEYHLYICPTDYTNIDLKLLLANSFTSIKHQASVETNNSLFIKYIFPHRTPNKRQLNTLSKTHKIVGEYCLFFIKRTRELFHLDRNLDMQGWNLTANAFENHVQKVIFNPRYIVPLDTMNQFNVGVPLRTNFISPFSEHFTSLTELHDRKSMDVKLFLKTRNNSLFNAFADLLENGLVFPYLKLKNLNLLERVYLILPNVKQEDTDTLLKIFHFFNFGFIHEIEGETFFKEHQKEEPFEHGLYIKLYLPDLELSAFFLVFRSLFHYLGIKHYVILSDMVDGSRLLQSIFGSLDFLEKYNPLKNLTWNPHDQKWMNHKLYKEEFEKKYPELLPEQIKIFSYKRKEEDPEGELGEEDDEYNEEHEKEHDELDEELEEEME